jgi:hypothetical protein
VLIVALVLAVVGLAALVTAVVTSNELIAWVCIGASVIGVVLLIVDALRERSRDGGAAADVEDGPEDRTEVLSEPAEDYPDDATTQIPTYADADTGESDTTRTTTETESTPAKSTSEAETTAVAVEDDPADDDRPRTTS